MPWPNARQPVKKINLQNSPGSVLYVASHPMSGDWGQLCGGHFVYLYSFGNPTYCSEVRPSLSEVETNNGKYNKANPWSILRVKVLTGLAIEKECKCYSICIFSTRFQTLWKENRLCNPLPFGNLSLSDPLPLGISMILRGGGGVWIFSGTTQCMFTANAWISTQGAYLIFWVTRWGGGGANSKEGAYVKGCLGEPRTCKNHSLLKVTPNLLGATFTEIFFLYYFFFINLKSWNARKLLRKRDSSKKVNKL